MRRYVRWLLMTALAVIAAQPINVGTQTSTPPILLITNSTASNPFGAYLAEILRAEGLNQFASKELSSLLASDLTNVQLVVLAETPLTAAQSNVLSNYVAGGGRLVAMRPDDQLAPVLGLTPTGASTNEGYFLINTATAFADGFPAVTLPFHGQAKNYTAAGASTVLATIYSDAVTGTAFPAVIKSGRTATWAYDLARSVIYTRQGNPANASDRDGLSPYRTEDLFYNAIDRDKLNIPYADVQMRMLGRVISDLLADVMPLPRLWYFPNAKKTVMVLTGDSHTSDMSVYQSLISAVESYGGRLSMYISRFVSLQQSDLATWRTAGHEIGMHPFGAADGVTLGQGFQVGRDWFANNNWGTPSPTVRIHQIEWQGWVDGANIEAANGIGLDTSFYTWGPAVIYPDGHQAHGYINGSGLPMRFVDQSGGIVPVYQQVTSVIDEQLVWGSFSEQLSPDQALAVTRNLIDASQAGGYSAITTQFHFDYFNFAEVQPWAVGTMAYAQSLGIPMWTAERWLNYTTARGATTLTGLSWDATGKQLAFTVGVPTNTEAQTLALPGAYNNFSVSGVTVDGSSASVVTDAISARSTSLLTIAPGTHNVVVTYATPVPPPEHAPIARDDSASVSEAHTVVIPVLANDSDADGDVLMVASTSSDPGAVITINADQTISYAPNPGTCGTDTFSYGINDGRGGTASANVTVGITCLNGQVVHQTFADFAPSCAVAQGTIVSRVGDGEVRLAGNQGDEYSQAALDSSKWVAGTWAGGTYTPALSAGILSIANANGAYVRSLSAAPATTLEASARFSALPWEHIGWAELNFAGAYAVFSTFNSTTSLFARTSLDGSSEQQTNLGPIPTGFHSFRIDRQILSPTSNLVSYYIDGVVRAQHTVGSLPQMYVYQSHNGGAAQTLDIDRIWAYPSFVGSGTYHSCTMDIGHTSSSWRTAEWNLVSPANTTFRLRTRTSSDGISWSGWSAPLTSSGQDISSPQGRYLQYSAEFTTADPSQSAVLDSVTMRYADNAIPLEHSPIATSDAASSTEGSAVVVSVLLNDSDEDNDPLTVTSASPGAKGAVSINVDQTITYTPGPGVCGADSFSYAISDGRGGTASTTVAVNIACLTRILTHTTLTDFSPSCSVLANTIVTSAANGEVRLAGQQGDEFATAALDPALWVAGRWNGDAYTPVPVGGVLSLGDANGAFVRSVSSMAVTSMEASTQFAALPWQHVGWGSLGFTGGYAIFSTFNAGTDLFARTNDGSGELQTNLGPIPSGFHTYRIDRQAGAPASDVINYYIDGVLVAQHAVGTLGPMYLYLSHNGGASQTLDVERVWVYPAYRDAGTFQSCTMDGGVDPFTWTDATWNATVPAGTNVQVSTRTSADGTAWSQWSVLTNAGGITSPSGRYLQYLLALDTTDSQLSAVVDAVSVELRLSAVDSTPPVLSDITASNATSSSALISWTTDEPSSSGVQYGPTRAYGFQTNVTTLTTAHSQLLTGLNGGTAYNYRVMSRDSGGNEADSANLTFVTAGPSLSIGNTSVVEGDAGVATASFTVSLSAPSSQTVTVSFATAPGTATSPSDFTAASGPLTFAPGITSVPVAISVNGDTTTEPDETFSVNLSNPVNASIAVGQGVGTIVNDDAPPTVSINDVSVAEGDSNSVAAKFTVTLSRASSQMVTVNYATANGTATAGSDYTAVANTLTFAPGATSQTLTVTTLGDTTLEPNETFFVNLSTATNATIADSQGIGTILNNDPPALTINSVSVPEGNSGTVNATFAVTLSQPTTQTVTVNYTTANGTASSATDYVAKSGTLTFSPGTTTASVSVVVNGDTTVESNETFFVNLSGAVNATMATAQGVGTIVTDDLPALTISDVSVTEGNSTTVAATFTVTLTPASTQTVTVNYATADGTATAGSDYTATSGSLTFSPGATSRTVTVTTLGDTTFEPNETFFVNLSSPTNATIADPQGVGTILNNDLPALTINDVSAAEGSPVTFTVTLSAAISQMVTVNYATANGTATAGSDYTAASGTLTFAPGTTSRTVTVTTLGDTALEPNETFVVNLSSATSARIADSQGVGTILNNDPPTLTINNASATEGSPVTFTVTLSQPTTQIVTVNYATANGTAIAGSDYTAASGTLTFAAGATTQTLAIATTGDTTPEGNDTFVVNLSGAAGATIGDSQGAGTINDNDGTMTVTAPNTAVTWLVGSSYAITWTNNLGIGATNRIEISRDGGSSWSVLAASVANSSATGGSFTWTASGTTTSSARIRVTWTVNSAVTDSSNVNFTIANPTITVVSPNGLNTWIVGTTATVTWSSNLPSSDNVRIELSTNGGTSYSTLLASSTPNDGTQSFTVQSSWRSLLARIRVTWLTNTSISDVSNATFIIQ